MRVATEEFFFCYVFLPLHGLGLNILVLFPSLADIVHTVSAVIAC